MTEVESTNFVAYRKIFPFSFKMRKSQSHSLQLKWPALKRICEKHSEDMLSESSVYQGLGMDWGDCHQRVAGESNWFQEELRVAHTLQIVTMA
jgi:hypothetical protein